MLWSAAHATLLDRLCGEGYVIPGGADEISRLVRPIGLSADHALLLVGAGTGGPVLSVAAEFGASVTGFEAVDAFARVAADRIGQAGARASVAPWSVAAPVFGLQVFDHALALMPLGGAEPDLVLGAIGAAIKPGGHLVLLEIVADETDLTGVLERLGFDVHMVEDVTTRHLRLAMAGWQRLLQTLDRRPSPPMAAVLMAEAERSLSCSDLMRAGRLRLVRWHAIQDSAQGMDLGAVKLEIMLAVQFRKWRDAVTLWETLSQADGLDFEARTMRAFIKSGIARDRADLPADIRNF